MWTLRNNYMAIIVTAWNITSSTNSTYIWPLFIYSNECKSQGRVRCRNQRLHVIDGTCVLGQSNEWELVNVVYENNHQSPPDYLFMVEPASLLDLMSWRYIIQQRRVTCLSGKLQKKWGKKKMFASLKSEIDESQKWHVWKEITTAVMTVGVEKQSPNYLGCNHLLQPWYAEDHLWTHSMLNLELLKLRLQFARAH